jgi:hypothetical protein
MESKTIQETTTFETLPRDMMNEILSRLSDHELFRYGMTSKKSLENTEHIWKKRYENLNDCDDQEHQSSLNWYSKYFYKSSEIFITNVKKDMNIFFTLSSSLNKKLLMEKIYDYLVKNIPMLSRKRFESLNTILKGKLWEFIESSSLLENEIARKYYPLLYPKEYNEYLITKYLYEDDEIREDPDYL